MTTVRMTLQLFGDFFDVGAFINEYDGELDFNYVHKKGDWSNIRNQLYEDSCASSECSKKPITWAETEGFISSVSELKNYIKKYSIDQINVFCTVYDDGQCNLEFDSDYLKKISDIGGSLLLSCVGRN